MGSPLESFKEPLPLFILFLILLLALLHYLMGNIFAKKKNELNHNQSVQLEYNIPSILLMFEGTDFHVFLAALQLG